jgi:hypothetical protein
MAFTQAASSPAPYWVPILLAFITGLLGFLSAYFLQKNQERKEKEREKNAIRLEFLNPLLSITRSFKSRLETIDGKLHNEREREEMYNWFHTVKHPEHSGLNQFIDFAQWCNVVGYFAVSTIYFSAVYFYQARRVRRDFPLNTLKEGEAEDLLNGLAKVRNVIGSGYGIYEAIQDSVGDIIKLPTGSYFSYRTFCENLYKYEERVWLYTVLDYYRDIDKKTVDERRNIISTLGELENVVEKISGLRSGG